MPLIPVLLLLFAVILVNGWTDAPNAIATAVAAEALSFPAAVSLAELCNLLGVVCTLNISDAVARTLWSMADFGSHSLTALSAALAATVLWAVFAWRFGVPTSESHALISGLAGAKERLSPGDGVSVYIKSIRPERMKIKLQVIEKLPPAPAGPIHYKVTDGRLEHWAYSPPGYEKAPVETVFTAPSP